MSFKIVVYHSSFIINKVDEFFSLNYDIFLVATLFGLDFNYE